MNSIKNIDGKEGNESRRRTRQRGNGRKRSDRIAEGMRAEYDKSVLNV